jgi:hypothetical protein
VEFALDDPVVWHPAGKCVLYRWIPDTADYGVIDGWRGRGRFDCGPPTLYFSFAAAGALAEWYRRHPEMLPYQNIKGTLSEVELNGSGEGLNVSTQNNAATVGVPRTSAALLRPKAGTAI